MAGKQRIASLGISVLLALAGIAVAQQSQSPESAKESGALSWVFVNWAEPTETPAEVLTENRIEMPVFSKETDAVTVKRGGLVHTRQLLGLDNGKGDFGFGDLIGQLRGICRAHEATLKDVAKLNLYANSSDEALMGAVEEGLKENWKSSMRPAVTLTISPLIGKTRLAADAVIAAPDSGTVMVERFERDAATMPSGRDILYLSGRAASGEIAEATSGTMTELFAVLAHLGSEPKDVVQVKAFINPMSAWETVEREIEKSFGDLGAPPLVFVEWSSTSRATEIELIAAAPDAEETGESVSYFTPPGDKSSPVYSRVARVHGDTVIYTRGLVGMKGDAPADEVKRVFDDLRKISEAAGGDLRHLAKATYYVSDDALSSALNEVRPLVYDPQRPPAASKVAVPLIGKEGGGLLMDFIAAPAAK